MLQTCLFQALHDYKLNVEKVVEHSGRLFCTLAYGRKDMMVSL